MKKKKKKKKRLMKSDLNFFVVAVVVVAVEGGREFIYLFYLYLFDSFHSMMFLLFWRKKNNNKKIKNISGNLFPCRFHFVAFFFFRNVPKKIPLDWWWMISNPSHWQTGSNLDRNYWNDGSTFAGADCLRRGNVTPESSSFFLPLFIYLFFFFNF